MCAFINLIEGIAMYVLLGSNGQITSQLAALLLAAGHPLRVVGRSADTLAPLARAGAEVAVGDVADSAFLERAFAGARGAYTMIPPCYAEQTCARRRIASVAIARALSRCRSTRREPVQHGGGAVARHRSDRGLHAQEQRLSAVRGIDCCAPAARPFMQNLLPRRQWQPAFFWRAPDATSDGLHRTSRPWLRASWRRLGIAASLLHAPRHITMREAAAALGAAIGKPGLAYVQSAPAEGKAELRAHGFSASAADQIEVLARWLSTSPLGSARVAPVEVQPTTIEVFARKQFEPAHAGFAPAVA
jgi:uncharacterized protein YbjT (DUF2867 family)